MEQRVFAFSFIIEGTTEKALQFIIPLNSIYNQNLGFIEQKNVFLKQENIYYLTLFLSQKNSDDLFRAATYRVMLVLPKDALFHLKGSFLIKFHHHGIIDS
jgi:hypothetical protein